MQQLANLLVQEGWSPTWSSLVPLQPGGSKPTFFCAAGGAGNLLGFRYLARHLGSDQPFYGLQPQGLDGKQAPYTRIEDIASHYIKEIRSVQPEGPYLLGGGCFGGILAFEMAQQLREQDQKVAMLALIDTGSPEPSAMPFSPLSMFQQKLNLHLGNLSALGSKEKLGYLAKRMKRKVKNSIKRIIYKVYIKVGIPLPHELRDRDVLDANSQAARAYMPKVYPGKVILFWAHNDPTSRYHDHEKMLWSKWATGGVQNYDLPGDHTSMYREPHVQFLAEQLRVCIDNAQKELNG